MLQQVSGVVTPVGVATAYHLYNQTRSESLITLNNKLGQGISYDSLHRQFTSQSLIIMQRIEENEVYVPQNMSYNGRLPHLFAMDNLDWKKKTLEGGASMQRLQSSLNHQKIVTSWQIPLVSVFRAVWPEEELFLQCKKKIFHIVTLLQHIGKHLSNMMSIDNRQTTDDGIAHLVWKLCRVVQISSQLLEISQRMKYFPVFNLLCTSVLKKDHLVKLHIFHWSQCLPRIVQFWKESWFV